MAAPADIPRRRLEWLQGELEEWRRDGLVDEYAAAAIEGRYAAGGRASVVRLLLYLGAALVGVGALWLVAANLWDGASPLVRAVAVAALWLACVAAVEARVRPARSGGRPGRGDDPVAGALAALAAVIYGGLVFQVAQSLQVPAYEPSLLGAWALGALAYAYAVGGRAPLLVGLAAGVGWLVWSLLERADPALAVVAGLGLAAPAAVALAALHEGSPREALGPPWRVGGALLALLALGVAALPEALPRDPTLPRVVWAAAAVVGVVALVAALRASRLDRVELAGALTAGAAAIVLVLVAPSAGASFAGERTGAEVAYALVAAGLFLVLAVAVAADGAARSLPALTNVAMVALVIFVTVQSFAVVAPIASRGTLFLVVGGLLVITALVADRGRRRLLRRRVTG